METDFYRLLSCEGKVRYAVREDAAKALRRIDRRKGRAPKEVVEVYSCCFCDGWHFGHPPHKARK